MQDKVENEPHAKSLLQKFKMEIPTLVSANMTLGPSSKERRFGPVNLYSLVGLEPSLTRYYCLLK